MTGTDYKNEEGKMSKVINYRDEAIMLVDDGIIDARDLVIMAVKYMSQAEVKDMLDCNDIAPLTQEQKDYDIDNDPMFKGLFSS